MKRILQTISILALSAMTASQATSQVKYILNKDTFVCYTQQENRDIAVIMLKGERDKSSLTNCTDYVTAIESTFNILNTEVHKADSIAKQLIKDKQEIQDNYNKELKDNKRNKFIMYGSVGLNILLILILL